MDSNPFLKNFMRMRQSIHSKEVAEGKVPGNRGCFAKKVSADVSTPNISIATIIEDKPKDKVVIEYFKRRCEELNPDT